MRTPLLRRPGRLALGDAAPWWRRSPSRLGRWVLAAGLALCAAAVVGDLAGAAADTVAGLGVTRRVVVARHDLEPGQVVADADVGWQARPRAELPDSAIDGDVVGRVVTAPIVAGEVVSTRRLAPDGVRGLAALVDEGDRAMAVPIEGTGLHVQVGDRVDVLAPDPADDVLGRRRSAAPVADDALVIDVTDTAVTLAVAETEAADLAGALGRGVPVLALVGGR
jgi:Flp pilus assembly protein CpaB